MKGKPKKSPREKDITARYLGGGMDMDRLDQQERFGDRTKHFQQRKTERTAVIRAAEEAADGDADALPLGDVIQVHSLFCEVEFEKTVWLCNVRRTLTKVSAGFVLV